MIESGYFPPGAEFDPSVCLINYPAIVRFDKDYS